MADKKKIAWVTGASSGIGAATTLRLVKDGWIVAATARSEDKVEVLVHHVEAFGVGAGRVVNYPGDVTDQQQMNDIVARIEMELGPIDLALLNAGVLMPDTSDSFTADHLKAQYEVNVFGTAHCLEPILKRFKSRNSGHIAIVGSFAGYRGLPRSISYGSRQGGADLYRRGAGGGGAGHRYQGASHQPRFYQNPDDGEPELLQADADGCRSGRRRSGAGTERRLLRNLVPVGL